MNSEKTNSNKTLDDFLTALGESVPRNFTFKKPRDRYSSRDPTEHYTIFTLGEKADELDYDLDQQLRGEYVLIPYTSRLKGIWQTLPLYDAVDVRQLDSGIIVNECLASILKQPVHNVWKEVAVSGGGFGLFNPYHPQAKTKEPVK